MDPGSLIQRQPPSLTPAARALLRNVRGWPWREMRPSARVDLLTLLAAERPAMRTQRLQSASAGAAWSRLVRDAGWAVATDEDYCVLARTAETAQRVLKLDAALERHTRELGLALGYPTCCASAAVQHGDEGLDDWARVQAARIPDGLLHIGGYARGNALLSHIPCSADCAASLQQAARAETLRPALWRLIGSLPHPARGRPKGESTSSVTEPRG